MKAVGFHSSCSSTSICCIHRHNNLPTPNFSLPDGPPHSHSYCRSLQFLPPTISSIQSDRSDPPSSSQTSSAASVKKNRTPQHERMISLFRNIRSSIANTESGNTGQPDFHTSPAATEIVHEETVASGAIWSKKNRDPDPEKQVMDFKRTRPPSNYVKRSPIPSPSIRGPPDHEESAAVTNGVTNLHKVEKLKLAELHELAKMRGIKGYSRMKKMQLLQQLRS